MKSFITSDPGLVRVAALKSSPDVVRNKLQQTVSGSNTNDS